MRVESSRTMRMRKRGILFMRDDRRGVLLATLIVSVILAFLMFASSHYYYKLLGIEKEHSVVLQILSLRTVASLLTNILFFYVLLRIQSWVISKYRFNQYQLWLVLVALLVGVVFLSPYLSQLQWWWYREKLTDSAYVTVQYVKDLVIVLVTFLFAIVIYMMKQYHITVMEKQELELENLTNRYNALKNQIDPHFLFNSFNTLTGLIGYDDDRAREYVQELAQVFRYTMQDKMVVRLADELEFVRSYLYLMRIRYFDSLQVEWDIEEKYLDYYVIPIAVQVLVENAIKHNVTTARSPLTINIRTTEDGLIEVDNKLQKKVRRSEGGGVGLTNLIEQYHMIFGKEIEILNDGERFVVALPLVRSLGELKAEAKSLLKR